MVQLTQGFSDILTSLFYTSIMVQLTQGFSDILLNQLNIYIALALGTPQRWRGWPFKPVGCAQRACWGHWVRGAAVSLGVTCGDACWVCDDRYIAIGCPRAACARVCPVTRDQ